MVIQLTTQEIEEILWCMIVAREEFETHYCKFSFLHYELFDKLEKAFDDENI